jgi:peptidoglycan/LPS O-acetylase OafA/YrhL
VLFKGTAAASLLPNLAASLFYVHGLVFGEMSRINFVAWSLEIEIQFYILAPFLALVFALRGTRLRRAALFGGILSLIALRTANPVFWQEHLSATVIYYIEYFLAGFLLVDFYVVSWHENPSRSLLWDAIALAAWCGVVGVQFHDATQSLLPLVILAAYVATFRGVVFHRMFSQPWLVTIGGMCYTIYLYHFYIISAVGRWTTGLSAGSGYLANICLQAALILPFVLAVSAVLFVLCEKPFMVRDWPARWKSALTTAWRNKNVPRDPSLTTPVLETPVRDAPATETLRGV